MSGSECFYRLFEWDDLDVSKIDLSVFHRDSKSSPYKCFNRSSGKPHIHRADGIPDVVRILMITLATSCIRISKQNGRSSKFDE